MRGAIPPFPQYAFMVWCSVKKSRTTALHYLFGLLLYNLTTAAELHTLYTVERNAMMIMNGVYLRIRKFLLVAFLMYICICIQTFIWNWGKPLKSQWIKLITFVKMLTLIHKYYYSNSPRPWRYNDKDHIRLASRSLVTHGTCQIDFLSVIWLNKRTLR
jgi:hypothetical protein